MKVFITGGTGLLGTALCYQLMQRGDTVYLGYRTHRLPIVHPHVHHRKIEITEPSTLRAITECEPDVVIHAASLRDVDYCELHPDETNLVNINGTYEVACHAQELEARMLYVSTNDIFGNDGPYKETDSPAEPLNAYAESKLQAEYAAQSINPYSLIVRTSFHGWHYIPSRSYSQLILEGLSSGQQFYMATDMFSSVMYAGDAAAAVLFLIDKQKTGVWHVASRRPLSRYGFALNLAHTFGLDANLILPDNYANIHKRLGLIAERPLNATLDVSKLESAFNGGWIPSVEYGIYTMYNDSEFKATMCLDTVRW